MTKDEFHEIWIWMLLNPNRNYCYLLISGHECVSQHMHAHGKRFGDIWTFLIIKQLKMWNSGLITLSIRYHTIYQQPN